MADSRTEIIIPPLDESASEEDSLPSPGERPSEEHTLPSSEENSLPPLEGNTPPAIICRVPPQLRETNKNAYTPKVVSIGPFHHGGQGLKGMEKYKTKYLDYLTKETKVTKEAYMKYIRLKEDDLRACYAEIIDLDADVFVEIILVDAAFIIVFLLGLKFERMRPKEDYVFRNFLLTQQFWPDFLLLENQLPFFILEDLFDQGATYGVNGEQIRFFDLFCHFFTTCLNLEVPNDRLEERRSNIEHFVDFLRKLYIPWDGQPGLVTKNSQGSPTLSITKLHQAGVRFRPGSSRNLFDLQFNDGTLEIPKLIIGRETDISISNLLAFEQCRHPDNNYINDYVALMNTLLSTKEDVDLLVGKGIVENRLPNDKFLFNKLAEGILYSNESYFSSLSAALHNHCRKAPRNCRAYVVKHFFKTPKGALTLILSLLALTFTLFQMMWSVVSEKSSDPSG